MRNIDHLSNLKLDQSDIDLSTKLRNLGVVFDENLSLKNQITTVKKKAIGGLLNMAKILKFIDIESKLKHVHGFILTQTGFFQIHVYTVSK